MRIHTALCSLSLVLAGLAGTSPAQAEPQVIQIPLTRPGEPIHLEISILSARIEVIGEDRQDAQFEVSVADGTRRIITPSGPKMLTGGAYAVEVDERDNRLSLDTDWRAERVLVTARVPRQANLELQTVNDGEIIVRDISGTLLLDNTNGPITATGISGSVIAESVNDDIKVDFASIDTGNVTSFASINGDLHLGLPEGAGAELHIDSAEGEIYSDFEVEVQPTKPVVSRKERRNGVEVSVESVIIARVGGGGAVVKLKTLNGDIRIGASGG